MWGCNSVKAFRGEQRQPGWVGQDLAIGQSLRKLGNEWWEVSGAIPLTHHLPEPRLVQQSRTKLRLLEGSQVQVSCLIDSKETQVLQTLKWKGTNQHVPGGSRAWYERHHYTKVGPGWGPRLYKIKQLWIRSHTWTHLGPQRSPLWSLSTGPAGQTLKAVWHTFAVHHATCTRPPIQIHPPPCTGGSRTQMTPVGSLDPLASGYAC